VAGRRGQARAQRVELVVQTLLRDLALGNQAAAIPHCGTHCPGRVISY
jgi:hypothetical protein